jgi:hypothetical protein
MKLDTTDFPEVIVEAPGNETLRFARDELVRYARAMFGTKLTFGAQATLAIGVDAGDPELGEEGYRIAVGTSSIRVSGGSPLGALYGVYALLKDLCGCCFAAPGANGEFIPSLRSLELPETSVVRRPLLWYRGMQFTRRLPWRTLIDAFDWMAKNGFNYVMYLPLGDTVRDNLRTLDPNTGDVRGAEETFTQSEFRQFLLPEIRRRGLKVDMSHHNLLGVWLPPGRYFKDHPDWYPLVEGKRQANSPQLAMCTSNREAVDQLIRNVRGFLHENPEVSIVGVIPQDGWSRGCECAGCARLDHPADMEPPMRTFRVPEGENRRLSHRYALLLNQVAEALAGEFPAVRIGSAHYVDLQWPPRRAKLHRNILPMVALYWRCGAHPIARDPACRMNDFYRDLIEQWAAAQPQGFILYEYYMGMNAQASLPYPMVCVLAGEWPEFIRLGIQGATLQSNPLNYRAYGVNYLTFAAAAWAERADGDRVLDYWLQGMFGAAAPAIRPIYEGFDRAVAKIAAGTEHDALRYAPPAVGHLLPNAGSIAYFVDELTAAFLDACVDDARRRCVTAREQAQVEQFAGAVTYWKLAADYFRLRQRALSPAFEGFTAAELADFRAKHRRLEAHRQAIAASGWAGTAGPIKFPADVKRRPG